MTQPNDTPRVSVVLAAYNEAGNIQPLLRRIRTALDGLGAAYEFVLVIEGMDGTKEQAEALMGEIPNIRILYGPKPSGLGNAFRRGFAAAGDQSDIVVMMDADLNHHPEELPAFFEAWRKGADFVIGSRYVQGGRMQNVPAWKNALSRIINKTISLMTGVQVADKSSGYRLIRLPMGKQVAAETVSTGFDFMMEFLIRASRAGAKIVEVPILFTFRTVGVSKMRKLPTMVNYLRLFWRLAFGRHSGSTRKGYPSHED